MRRLDYRPPNEVRLPSILHLDLARTVGSARTPKDVVASSTQPYWRCSDGRTRLRRRLPISAGTFPCAKRKSCQPTKSNPRASSWLVDRRGVATPITWGIQNIKANQIIYC
jgi:hypothetical protein